MPFAASCSPSPWELVSGICPRRSSVPTATISTRTRDHSLSYGVVLPPGVEGQHDGQPDGHEGERGVMPGDGQDTEANGPVLYEGLPLGQSTRGYRRAVSRGARPVHAHPDLSQGDDDRGHHEELDAVRARDDDGVEPAEDDHFVGEGVEERARTASSSSWCPRSSSPCERSG